MPTIVSDHRVHTPLTLQDAVTFLADHPAEHWRPLAGGTDVMVEIYRDRTGGNRWLNLARLRSILGCIDIDGEQVRIGALATMAELHRSALLRDACPLIGQAAAVVGAVQVQNRATVGGNIVNGSPAGDTLPVWLALDAELELVSVRGQRRIPFASFMTGYRRTILEPDELLVAVRFRPRYGERVRILFRKIAARAAQGISKVVLSGMVSLHEGRYQRVRLAFGSMGPTVLRARAAEAVAEGGMPSSSLGEQVAALLANDLHPQDDHRSTADYRLRVARNLVREFLAGHLVDVEVLHGDPFGK